MSPLSRNFVMAYIVLVALPLLGLVGILKGGRTLKAPPSVDGIWSLQIDSAQLSSLPCGKTLASTPEKTITISQSGKTFEIKFSSASKSMGSGTLDGATLRASVTPDGDWAAETGCGNGRTLTLLATVDGKANPRSLAGMLALDNCPACRAVEFHALQQSASLPKEGH